MKHPLVATLLLVASCMLIFGAAAGCNGNGEDEPETYRIGVMDALTGPGESYGTVINQAKQLAMEEINEAGGINGTPLELVVEDSKCNAADAITAYNKLTDVDNIKIILGTSCSGAMLGIAPLAEEDGVILFSGSATNPDIADAGDFIFRNAISDAKLGPQLGALLWEDGIRTVASLSERTDYAEGVRRTTIAAFTELGGDVLATEGFLTETLDFRTQLTVMRELNPDALLVTAQAEASAGAIIKQAREIGFTGPIYGDVVVLGTTALEVAGDSAAGVKGVLPDLDPANQKGATMIAAFRAKYGSVTLPWFLGSGYDAVYIAAECLKQTEDDQDTAAFRDCLYDITWSGTIGDNYTFDSRGEVVGLSNVVAEVLPVAQRTDDNLGYQVLGPAPIV